jgi:hypothetical protein
MCVDCVLAALRIAQVDPGDGPPSEVVLSQMVPSVSPRLPCVAWIAHNFGT